MRHVKKHIEITKKSTEVWRKTKNIDSEHWKQSRSMKCD